MIKKSRQSGFSLIELMVVIAIIAILSMIGISGYNNAMRKARDSRRKSDIQAISQALTLYRMDVGRYPSVANYKLSSDTANSPQDNIYPFGKYITTQQLFDPGTKSYSFSETGNVPYSYVCINSDAKGCKQFVVCAKMEAAGNGNFILAPDVAQASAKKDVLSVALGGGTPTSIGAVGNPAVRTTAEKNAGSSLEDWYCATSQ